MAESYTIFANLIECDIKFAQIVNDQYRSFLLQAKVTRIQYAITVFNFRRQNAASCHFGQQWKTESRDKEAKQFEKLFPQIQH